MSARIAHRLIALLAGGALVTAVGTAAAATQAAPVRFSTLPGRVVQGAEVQISVAVRSGARCSLKIRYADGALLIGDTAVATNGRARWIWTIGEQAPAGKATVTASCGKHGRASRSVLVVGSVIPVKIDVVKTGFSVRAYPHGGSGVSYGVILENRSPHHDALNLNILVNFVGPNNNLIGSASERIDGIAAGTQFAHGGELSFSGAAPVERLEVVVQGGGRAPKGTRLPALANIYVAPSPNDPGWVGSVEGEVINNQLPLTLQMTRMSAVVFDGAGNIIGGGTGSAFAPLPPGARQFFKLQNGFRPIPMSRAVDAMVSLEPRWAQTQGTP